MADTLNDTLDVDRPVPRRFTFTQPYWDATRDRRLLLQYCPATGQYQFFPRPISVFSGTRDLEWREVSGRGQVFTWTVARIGRPPFADAVPYVVATVTLDEGVNIISNLINCQLDEVAVGMRVKAAWAPLADGTNVLLFEPDAVAEG